MRATRLWANLATVGNAAVGIGAIAYVLAGNKLWAMLLIVCGIGFDGLDGWLSRRSGLGPSPSGRIADSVADAVTFGLAPASLLIVHTDRVALWTPWTTPALLVGVAVAACAVARLVYFTLRGYARPYFLGAPTPQTALGILAALLLFDTPAFLGLAPAALFGTAFALAVLGVLPVRFPKLRAGTPLRGLVTATALALCASLIPLQFHLARSSPLFRAAELAGVVAIIGIAAYYVLGPLTLARPAVPGAGGPGDA